MFQNSFMVEIFSEFPQLSSFRINAPLLFVTLQSWKNPNSWHLSIGCHNTWIMIWYYQWGPDPTKYLHKRGKLAPLLELEKSCKYSIFKCSDAHLRIHIIVFWKLFSISKHPGNLALNSLILTLQFKTLWRSRCRFDNLACKTNFSLMLCLIQFHY